MKLKITLLTLSLVTAFQLNAMEGENEGKRLDAISAAKRFLELEYGTDIHNAQKEVEQENSKKARNKKGFALIAGVGIGYLGYRAFITDTSAFIKSLWLVGVPFASYKVGNLWARPETRTIALIRGMNLGDLIERHSKKCNHEIETNLGNLKNASIESISPKTLIDPQVRKSFAHSVIDSELLFLNMQPAYTVR